MIALKQFNDFYKTFLNFLYFEDVYSYGLGNIFIGGLHGPGFGKKPEPGPAGGPIFFY